MKRMDFKLWKWFIPIFGFFYMLWFAYVTAFGGIISNIDNKFNGNEVPMWLAVVAQLYIVFHVYSIAIFIAWMLSILKMI